MPSATETIFLLGASRQLAGVTHECDYPPEALRKRRLVKISFDQYKMNSQQIDRKIRELLASGQGIYTIDMDALESINPDLVITQGLCEVCSPFTREIARAVNLLNIKPQVLILDPHNFDDIFLNVREIAVATHRTERAEKLLARLQRRVNRIRSLAQSCSVRVVCLEWLNPLFTAGHWIPQMVEIAGGVNGISVTGERSRPTTIDEIKQFDPEKILLMPCGFGVKRTSKEYSVLASHSGWNSIRAVQNGQVYAVDANSFFSKPGPRTVTGLEILSKIIQPEQTRSIRVPSASHKNLGSPSKITESVTLQYRHRQES